MPKLAGRGVFIAALAVPIAMVIAPLTATAEEPDETVVTEEQSGVATEDGAMASAGSTVTTEDEGEYVASEDMESDDVDHDGFRPGPAWYYHGPDEDNDHVTYVINGIHDDGDYGNETSDDTIVDDVAIVDSYVNVDEDAYEHEGVHDDADVDAMAVSPAHDVDVIEVDEDDNEWAEEETSFVTYEDSSSGAGSEGAWTSSTESGAFSENGGFGHGDVSGAYYEELTAAAGGDGAFVDSIESAAGHFGGFGHGDDDASGAYHEEFTAGAGSEGAWVDQVESAAGELG